MANHNDLDVKILTGFHGNPLILTKELENKTPTVTKKGELFIYHSKYKSKIIQ